MLSLPVSLYCNLTILGSRVLSIIHSIHYNLGHVECPQYSSRDIHRECRTFLFDYFFCSLFNCKIFPLNNIQ